MTNIGDIITNECMLTYAIAAEWCMQHNAYLQEIETFERDINTPTGQKRTKKFHRYKIVKNEYNDADNKIIKKTIRNQYLKDTDKYFVEDYPLPDNQKILYKEYRQYLRDYTKTVNWWMQNPDTFEQWIEKKRKVR